MLTALTGLALILLCSELRYAGGLRDMIAGGGLPCMADKLELVSLDQRRVLDLSIKKDQTSVTAGRCATRT
jgi:hypothetical protein